MFGVGGWLSFGSYFLPDLNLSLFNFLLIVDFDKSIFDLGTKFDREKLGACSVGADCICVPLAEGVPLDGDDDDDDEGDATDDEDDKELAACVGVEEGVVEEEAPWLARIEANCC